MSERILLLFSWTFIYELTMTKSQRNSLNVKTSISMIRHLCSTKQVNITFRLIMDERLALLNLLMFYLFKIIFFQTEFAMVHCFLFIYNIVIKFRKL